MAAVRFDEQERMFSTDRSSLYGGSLPPVQSNDLLSKLFNSRLSERREVEVYNRLVENNRRNGKNPNVKMIRGGTLDQSHYNPVDNSILSNDSIITAHELGHANNIFNVGKNRPSRFFRYGYLPAKQIGKNPAFMIAEMVNSAHSGYVTERNRQNGRKTNPLVKYKGFAVPLIANAPILFEEGRASRKGLGYLKKAGLEDREMRQARQTLAKAYGTYLLDAGVGLGLNAGAYYAGKAIARGVGKKEAAGRKYNAGRT